MEKPLRICRDCIWKVGELCSHQKAQSIDLVTGNETLMFCATMRMSGERCGAEGRLWTPAPDVYVDPDTQNPPF